MTESIQKELDFERLGRFQPRSFVPADANLTDLTQLKNFYENLLNREIHSSKDLEQWILDRSECEAAVNQAANILYIRMTCQTDDESRAEAYTQYVERIEPELKPLGDQLNQKYLKALAQFSLDMHRYEVYTRSVKNEVELFNPDNVPLQTQIQLLSQEYQSICGAMAVHFQGKERTLPEMNKFLLEQDRSVREKAWRIMAQRRLQDKDKLEEIFDKMLSLRHNIAVNSGYKNYCDYKFKELERFDYTPDDCKNYHAAIEQHVLPLWKEILEARSQQMNLPHLSPWDTAVDPLGRPALKPFERVETLISGCQTVFEHVDATFGEQFSMLAEKNVLDLKSRKGKAPGGYQSTLNESRLPFIFMNAVGIDDDVRTLFHEGGHAFHSLACRHDPLLDYRHGPMEFNEVASMAMELLAGEHVSIFYGEEDILRSKKRHLEDIIFVLIWVATIDAFQHWIYENPKYTREQRQESWLDIRKRFGSNFVCWDGLEIEHRFLWHQQLHIFEVPFYYIEYGIAQLGALQIWLNAKKNWGSALAQYRQGLSLGGAKPLPALFQAAGIRFDFSAQTISPLIDAIRKEVVKCHE